MKNQSEIEAALERSLRKQIVVPRLARSFDAGVWARIQAEEAGSSAPIAVAARVMPMTARMFQFVNVLGLASAAIVVCVFVAQLLAGADISFSLTQISAATSERIVSLVSAGITCVAIGFGLVFTPWGRKLRDEFS